MAVQFILGRSGTGKTSYCIKAIVDALLAPGDNQPLILLVPEQATYQAERAILADERVVGYNRLNVLSFDRLQFLLWGKDTARPALSQLGQQMVIHRILREQKNDLKVFGASACWPGLGRQMAETVTELHRYAKTPDDIERLLGELKKDERNSLAEAKFADIGLVLREYLKFIEGKFIDPDVQLSRSCKGVATANFAKEARLWVDGFAGFTTAELAILVELLKVVAEAQIALCLDASKIDTAKPDINVPDPISLFGPTERTYSTLVEAIKKCKLQLAEPVVLDKAVRFSGGPELAHIEENIFKSKSSKQTAANSIRIVSAPNGRSEVQFVAREIQRLVKRGDYWYRDIGVIASDIDGYQHYIKAYFGDYGIPFFIDRREPLSQHPVVGLICSALRVVLGGFCYSDIFTYLKTDLVPMERGDVDLLENYCLAFGITGGDWTSESKWQFAGEEDEHFDERQINQIRLKVSKDLFELRDRLCPVDEPRKSLCGEEFTRIIFDFLESLGVGERIAGWIEEAAREGDYATVDEHRQFYEKLLNVFDEFVEVFGGQAGTSEDYFAIINSAFLQMTLAFIPPTLDQVLVGSIERSRHPDLKAVFLIGATQKDFPVPVGFENILTDDDRCACESAGFELAVGTEQKLAERQYLAYIAFTRPSQFLCVTYPSVDEKGSCVLRSQFVNSLESLFENLSEESVLDYKVDVENIHVESELVDLLCSRLGKDAFGSSLEASHELSRGLLEDITSDEQLLGLGARVVSAINYDNRAELDKGIVKELFGRQIKSSATRLSIYAACPYQYFACYILGLEEREEFKLEPLDLGEFYHRVLDALLKRLNREKKDFASIGRNELLRFLREEISEVITTSTFISNFRRHSTHNAFIIQMASEVLEDCALAISEMVRAGEFMPVLSEVSFGQVKDSSYKLGDYELSFSGGRRLSLDGKIDRIDVAEAEGEKIAVVFDYKRRAKTFSWSEFYYALDMQLPIYMLAVGGASNPEYESVNTVGAFYMPVEVSPKEAEPGELPRKAESFGYKAKGIFDGSFFQQVERVTNSGWSKFYNFRITSKDEQYGDYGKSGALRPGDFEKVLRFTEKKIVELAEEIVSGRIEVKPYRLSGNSPCRYCKYKAVCRFDWQINDYNHLVSLGKEKILKKIETR
ncbi:MAG: exodeoxyribonuclease V subunit gamma [Planctomycetota bacterium]|nr:MAG: exodeoxyribonuclease V subunit gamma [Planctomycetota bacterium]